MRASIFFSASQGYLRTKTYALLKFIRKCFLQTPQRALNRAYHAALVIKLIEEKYNDGDFSDSSIKRNSTMMTALKSSFKQSIHIIRFGLMEFRLSYFLLGIQDLGHIKTVMHISENIEKLQLIDEVLETYKSNQDLFSLISRLQKGQATPVKTGEKLNWVTVDIRATEVYSRRR